MTIKILLLIAALLAINGLVWLIIIQSVRKRYPLPEQLRDPDPPTKITEHMSGYYLMTLRRTNGGEKGRFYGWHLLARGNGYLYLTDRGLHFLRRGTKRPLWIPAGSFRDVNVEISKRLKIRGRLSLEVDWELAGYRLRSVFVLGGGVSATRRVADWIQMHIDQRS